MRAKCHMGGADRTGWDGTEKGGPGKLPGNVKSLDLNDVHNLDGQKEVGY